MEDNIPVNILTEFNFINRHLVLSDRIKEMLKQFIISEETMSNYILKEFEYSKIYNKELKKSNINNKIISFITDKLKQTINYNNILPSAKFLLSEQINTKLYEQHFNVIYFSLLRLNTLFIDSYLLSRLYKTFNKNESYEPDEAKNIIIYAGETHIQTYYDFFTYNNCVLIEKSTYTLERCLNMENIKQPLFSNYIDSKKEVSYTCN